MKKLTKIIWATLMSILLLGFNPISAMAASQPVVVYDAINDFTYNLVKDDETERIINYQEGDMVITIIYDKQDISLTIIKDIDGQEFTEVFRTNNLLLRDNSSMFSPWKYSSSGNKYTLTAVIDGTTVSKTVVQTANNKGYIESFCNAVDDIREAEKALVAEIGVDLVGSLILTALTGGIGLPALLAAIGASAGALSTGEKINSLYARAEKAYKAL